MHTIVIFLNFLTLAWPSASFAMLNTELLEQKLFAENHEISALQADLAVKTQSGKASFSTYFPEINLVGSWQDNRTDDLALELRGYSAYIQGSWNIFSGFKDSARNKVIELETQSVRLTLEKIKKQMRFEMRTALSDLIVLHKFQDIYRDELEMVAKQKQIAARKAAAGVTGSVDNLEFDLREAELNIEIKQNAQMHEQAHEKLFSLFGAPVSDEETEKIQFDEKISDSIVDKKMSLNSNIDYQLAQLRAEVATKERTVVNAEFLPRLDVSAENGHITPTEKLTQSSNEQKFGVTLTWNIFSGFKDDHLSAASVSAISSAEHRVRQTTLEFERQVNTTKIKLEQLKALYDLNEVKLVSLKRYYELTGDEYRRGIKNSSDMVNAIDRFSAAKKKKFELLKDIDLAVLELNNLN